MSNIEKIVKACDDKQAEDIKVYSFKDIVVTESCIICSSSSTAHFKAIYSYVSEKFSDIIISIDGNKDSSWVIVEMEKIFLHILSHKARKFYKIEEFWKNMDKYKKSVTCPEHLVLRN